MRKILNIAGRMDGKKGEERKQNVLSTSLFPSLGNHH
jgi:hypothetical protein